jgi:SAM-dependent methyltransferase
LAATRSESSQDAFWERAGRAGYSATLFRSPRVARHVLGKQWRVALDIAGRLGLEASAAVLELGCGDGEFAVEVLGRHYRQVVALEKSPTAVERARTRPGIGNVRFGVADVVTHEYGAGDRWDGAFLIGFLHHVKQGTPIVVERLARVVPRVIVMEPNGNNPVRKLLEHLPSYRAGGEESFRLAELVGIFALAGYRLRERATINLFPPFTPDALFPVIRGLERLVEATPALHGLCSSHVLGFAAER